VLPTELIAAIAKEWGGYGIMGLFAVYFLWKYLGEASVRRQKRLDEQQVYVDTNWGLIRQEKDKRIAELEKEISEIRAGHLIRLQEMREQLRIKREEITRLNALVETLRADLEKGWDLARGAIKGWRGSYHERNNDRQITESALRLNNVNVVIPWTMNPEPPDLEDVERIKG
jgi:hypothetical protein